MFRPGWEHHPQQEDCEGAATVSRSLVGQGVWETLESFVAISAMSASESILSRWVGGVKRALGLPPPCGRLDLSFGAQAHNNAHVETKARDIYYAIDHYRAFERVVWVVHNPAHLTRLVWWVVQGVSSHLAMSYRSSAGW